MKKASKNQQFPRIYRLITESKISKSFLKQLNRLSNHSKLKKIVFGFAIIFLLIFCLILLVGIAFLGKSLLDKTAEVNKITLERKNIQKQINFWNSVSQKYPDYRDSYFRIALLEYKLGEIKESKINNEKAILLDPGFIDAKKLGEILKNY